MKNSDIYKNLSNYICNKYYYVETKEHGVFKGYILNYNFGNIVMLTLNGILHMPYSEICVLIPLREAKIDEDFKKMIDNINKKTK